MMQSRLGIICIRITGWQPHSFMAQSHFSTGSHTIGSPFSIKQTTRSFQQLYKLFRAVEHTQQRLNHVQVVWTEFLNTIELTLPL
jgi:hypothetical protein